MGAYEASGVPESRSTSQTTLTAQPGTVFYGQPVSLSATVADNSSSPILQGTVNFMDDWSVLRQSPLNNSGVATMSTSSLGVGPHWLVASFGGNTADQPNVSAPAEVFVNGFSTSTTISFSANPVNFGQPETLTATVSLGSGNPAGTGTPTGNIAFYAFLQPNVIVPLNASGAAKYTTSSLPAGTTYIQAVYQPTGGFLSSSSQNLPLQIVALPAFAISGTVVSVSRGATSGNQSTITVTPSGGFTGNVTVTATITASPTGVQDPPTLSFGSTSAVDITGASAGTAILTISTTAATSAALAYPERPGARWYNLAGLAFALVFGMGIPSRRSNWRTRLGLLVFLLASHWRATRVRRWRQWRHRGWSRRQSRNNGGHLHRDCDGNLR